MFDRLSGRTKKAIARLLLTVVLAMFHIVASGLIHDVNTFWFNWRLNWLEAVVGFPGSLHHYLAMQGLVALDLSVWIHMAATPFLWGLVLSFVVSRLFRKQWSRIGAANELLADAPTSGESV